MVVKNNYNECITNLACSIRKYFGLEYNHNTLEDIDKILEIKQPQNVVLILFDGMGSRVIDKILPENSFFIKNMIKEITTVFPATTTAATTSIRTGLNPIEHGWLGWNTYVAPIDKTITLFRDCEKDKKEACKEFLDIKRGLVPKTIVEEINEQQKYYAVELMPFGDGMYDGLDNMMQRIEQETSKDGKKFIYAYDTEPDHTIHRERADSEISKQLIIERNDKTEKLCNNLKDTLVIIVADHGHTDVENIFLTDYPNILDLLERPISIEPRAVSFKIKEDMQNKFEELFEKELGKYFTLYSKKDILDSKLFGDGEGSVLFKDAIGDYIAIAEKSNKCLIMPGNEEMLSHHAGYKDEEIYIPLIIVDKTDK